MQFRIFHSTGIDGTEWTDLIRRLKPNDQDIFFLPEYANIFNQTYGHEPFLAFYGNNDRFIIQVFVKRSLNELPFLKEQHITEAYFDIANPYGYGGPLCQCDSVNQGQQLFLEFNAHLTDYCYQNMIASEFCCLHPLLENQHYVSGSCLINIDYEKEVIYLDLTRSERELWSELRHGHQYSIKKAKKANVCVEKMPLIPANFAVFNNLYNQTMVRDNAAARWFFPHEYFWNYVLNLGLERVTLFFALVNEAPISAFLLIHDFSTLYYHFSATDSDYYTLSPNSLLMYEVILWAKRRGISRFHLGGGVTSSTEDNLFKFKSGFSKQHAKLYSYHRIHHHAIYDYLVSLKIQHEKMNGQEILSDYFPLYRR